MNSKILQNQSRACKDYMKFLDRKIAEERRKTTLQIVERSKHTGMTITYTKNK